MTYESETAMALVYATCLQAAIAYCRAYRFDQEDVLKQADRFMELALKRGAEAAERQQND